MMTEMWISQFVYLYKTELTDNIRKWMEKWIYENARGKKSGPKEKKIWSQGKQEKVNNCDGSSDLSPIFFWLGSKENNNCKL